MSNTSNFREAIRDARGQSLIGRNVIANALPYVGGGLVLTALGTYGGINVIANNRELFFPTFWVALIAELILFFVARGVAERGKNSVALPLLATYSLLSGYTLSGLVFVALGTRDVGIGGIAIAALGCGVTFIVARPIGSNLSEQDGMALTKTIQLGVIALLVVLVGQLLFSFFGVYTP
ncbi:MAG TPA: Bax inhibitor-1 family protein, partial [Candidatus Sericytochromatia bacterium]